ncbi:hypothetical protein F5146DRAFT_1118774 [Armillaria mellea]|nr:hypothetical protein F5146DRAFT_1118774 [Armillaria mellea]
MSARSGSNGMHFSDSILTAIPPRIVRIQVKHTIDETIRIRPPYSPSRRKSHLPLVLFLASYRCTISEDPEFIASNHDELMEPEPMRIPYCRCSPRKRQCHATYKTDSYRQYDGWARREVAFVNHPSENGEDALENKCRRWSKVFPEHLEN